MVESVAKWQQQVADAQERAAKVYNEEVERLQKQIDATDSKEAREVQRIAREVDLDAKFAARHVQHLENFVAHEITKVEHAYASLEEKAAKGESEHALQQAARHAVVVETDADWYVSKAVEHALEAIDRDAAAAARHLYVGLEKLGLDEDHLGKDTVVDQDKVDQALARVAEKAEQ